MKTAADNGPAPLIDPDTMAQLKGLLGQYRGPSGGGGSTGGPNDEPVVYLGRITGDHEAQGGWSGLKTMTMTNAKLSFHSWPRAEQQAWANKMYRAGLINDPGNFDQAMAQWQSAVEFAAGEYTYGHKQITPWEVMQNRLGLNKLQGNGNKPTGPVTTTSTSTAVQVLSNGDADNMIQAMFQNQLGRDPDKGELSRYRSMLINKLKDSPQTEKVTRTVDAKGNMKQHTTTSGGISDSALSNIALNKAKADPEWGAYQAATSYMGALENLLGGSPDLTGSNG